MFKGADIADCRTQKKSAPFPTSVSQNEVTMQNHDMIKRHQDFPFAEELFNRERGLEYEPENTKLLLQFGTRLAERLFAVVGADWSRKK